MNDPLYETIERINWHFGKGDIVCIDPIRQEVHRNMPFAGNDTRKYRLSDDQQYVIFLGHKCKISSEGQ